MRAPLARLTVIGLLVALTLAGCGPQPADDNNVEAEGEAEEVYIFPDGTEVTGEAAAWLKEAMKQLIRFKVQAGDLEDARQVLGDIFAMPDLPDRFHLVDVRVYGQDKHVIMNWAAPATKEWVELALSPAVVDVTATGQLWCDDGTEGDAKIWEVYPWAKNRCMALTQTPKAYAHLFMLNVPEEEAARIAESLDGKLLAAARED